MSLLDGLLLFAEAVVGDDNSRGGPSAFGIIKSNETGDTNEIKNYGARARVQIKCRLGRIPKCRET